MKDKAIKLTKGLVISLLIVSAFSQFVGNTYGQFSDAEQVGSGIQACEVFPSVVEDHLTNLKQHFINIGSIQSSIHQIDVATIEIPEVELSMNADSKELQREADSLTSSINQLTVEHQSLQRDKQLLLENKSKLKLELEKIRKIMIQFKTYLSYDANCTEIDKPKLINQVEQAISQSNGINQVVKDYLRLLIGEFKVNNENSIDKNHYSYPEINMENFIDNDLYRNIEALMNQLDEKILFIEAGMENLNSAQKDIHAKAKEKVEEEKTAEETKVEANQKKDKEMNSSKAGDSVKKDANASQETETTEIQASDTVTEEPIIEPVKEPVDEEVFEEPLAEEIADIGVSYGIDDQSSNGDGNGKDQ